MGQVDFILDEAPAMGRLEAVEDALGIGRAYGIRLQIYAQSLGQLSKFLPEGQETTLLSNCTQTFFGVSDLHSAEMISNQLGPTTVLVESSGDNSGSSGNYQDGPQSSTSRGWSSGENRSWQPQSRKLAHPDEILRLPPRIAITFVPGLPPIRTRLVRYYEPDFLGKPETRFRQWLGAWSVLLRSAVLCAFALLVAWAISTPPKPPVKAPIPPVSPSGIQRLNP